MAEDPGESAPRRRRVEVFRLGEVPYEPTHELQQRLVDEVTAGSRPDTLLVLEHPRTITLGRSASEANILFSEAELSAKGYQVHDIGRGGDVTYHGPGQLVAYPIFDLKPDRKDVRRYIRDLEMVMIQTCAQYGVEASAVPGLTGTWVEDRKVGAIGVRISRWVTMHGLALNVNTHLEDFGAIVPCGIQDKAVTSLARETGKAISMDEAIDHLVSAFGEQFSADFSWLTPPESFFSSGG